MKKFKKSELTNSLLFEIFTRNLPNYKVYNRNEDGIDKVIVQKNGSVAVSFYVKDEENKKIIKIEYSNTDSFFHMYVLQWILFLFAVFPLIIWFIVHVKGRSDLHWECVNVIKPYFNESEDIYLD